MQTPIAKALPIAAALVLLVPWPALASSGDVIRDCSADGSLEGNYSQGELSGALDNLPSDIDEYTDCRTVIRRAQLAGAKGKGNGSPRGVISRVDHSAPVNPAEQRHIEQATHGRSQPVDIAGTPVRPGATGAALAASGLGTDLPSSVLVALIGLGLAMVAGGAYAVQRRWPNAWSSMGEGVRRGISRFRR
jgi:hypothetical protein